MARRSVVGGKSDRATANRRKSSDVIAARRIRIPSLRREEFKIGCDQRRHRWESKKEEVTAARDCRVICNPQGSSTGNDMLLFGGFGFKEVEDHPIIVGAIFRRGIKTNPLLF